MLIKFNFHNTEKLNRAYPAFKCCKKSLNLVPWFLTLSGHRVFSPASRSDRKPAKDSRNLKDKKSKTKVDWSGNIDTTDNTRVTKLCIEGVLCKYIT